MSSVIGDTHAIIWHLLRSANSSERARATFNAAALAGSPIYVASISLVEVYYLVERGRVPQEVPSHIENALADVTNALEFVPLNLDVARAVARVPRGAVPDMPDRIIAATALHLNLPLISRDRAIRATRIQTIW